MLKMADACQRAGGQQTRFHEMHVQRHNNVSAVLFYSQNLLDQMDKIFKCYFTGHHSVCRFVN